MAEMHKYQTKEILNKVLNVAEDKLKVDTTVTVSSVTQDTASDLKTESLPAAVTTTYTEAVGALSVDVTTDATIFYGMVMTVEKAAAGNTIVGNILQIRNDTTAIMEIIITEDLQTIQFFPGLGMSLSGGLNLKGHSGNDANIDWRITTYYTH